MQNNSPVIIVFTGPESTAKSSLSRQISESYHAEWIPEYARKYIEALNRPYTYGDVEKIALRQKESFETAMHSGKSIIVFDTFLIITKVWFMEVYGRMPEWIDHFLKSIKIDLHLLCYPDIDWEQDGVRENEDKRQYLFERYEIELETYNFVYKYVKGHGEKRIQLAINHINQLLKNQIKL